MKTPRETAPVSLRWTGYFLTFLLTFLLIWLLGFLVSDIGKLQGPIYQDILDHHVETSLVERQEELSEQISDLNNQIKRQREIQQTLRKSMDNAQKVMEQMMSLHRLSLEQQLSPSETERNAMANSQTRFLTSQERYEQANEAIASSESNKHTLNLELTSVSEQINKQHEPAREEYNQLRRRHQFKVAAFKLAVIVPLFVVAAWIFYRKRESPFRPIFLAALIATFWRVGVIMFDHFPRDFFKYIAIGATILIVIGFLLRVLRSVVSPGMNALLKRYRESYNHHHCPICSNPIARGPFKHAIWTRKGPINLGGAAAATSTPSQDTPYACPSCGTSLFETCDKCGKDRHSLLPFCESCGTEKKIEADPIGS